MARARLQLVYNKETGRHELLIDMEQETLDRRRHDARHERLVRKLVGEDADIEEVPDDAERELVDEGVPQAKTERESRES